MCVRWHLNRIKDEIVFYETEKHLVFGLGLAIVCRSNYRTCLKWSHGKHFQSSMHVFGSMRARIDGERCNLHTVRFASYDHLKGNCEQCNDKIKGHRKKLCTHT